MAVVGFDFGNQNSVVAVAQRGGIDVLMNEVSSRLSPSLVGFGDKMRFTSEAALSQVRILPSVVSESVVPIWKINNPTNSHVF
jgi:heat shock protein 4